MEPKLVDLHDGRLVPHGFRRVEDLPGDAGIAWMAAWTRRTWNTNRGVAVVRMPDDAPPPGRYAGEIRKAAGRAR